MIVLSDADRVVMWRAMLDKLIDPRCAPAPGGVVFNADGTRRPPTDAELREVAVDRLRGVFITADLIVAEYERRGANVHKSMGDRLAEIMAGTDPAET